MFVWKTSPPRGVVNIGLAMTLNSCISGRMRYSPLFLDLNTARYLPWNLVIQTEPCSRFRFLSPLLSFAYPRLLIHECHKTLSFKVWSMEDDTTCTTRATINKFRRCIENRRCRRSCIFWWLLLRKYFKGTPCDL